MPITIGGVEKVQQLNAETVVIDAHCFTSDVGVNTSDQYALTFSEFMKIVKNVKPSGYKLQLIIPKVRLKEIMKEIEDV